MTVIPSRNIAILGSVVRFGMYSRTSKKNIVMGFADFQADETLLLHCIIGIPVVHDSNTI
jgi:hypothetical protein